MPCEVIGAGTAARKQIRGSLYHVQDTPASWGARELDTPHFWICTISDATAAQVAPLLERASENDGYEGPRWLMTPAEVVNANGKDYGTLGNFQSFLVDQS